MKEDRRSGAPERAAEVLTRLKRLYPDATTDLVHETPFQLLVATILSARTTDKAVNQLAPRLFGRYPDAAALAAATTEDVAALINTIGMYRNKAKAIVETARVLVDRHDGRVPRDRAALESLAGVGRKTASVVLSTAFHEPALAVDTHVARLAGVLGFSGHDDPRDIEDDLTSVFPREEWGFVSHALIWHGRQVCVARSPRCPACALSDICPSAAPAPSSDNRRRGVRKPVPAAPPRPARRGTRRRSR